MGKYREIHILDNLITYRRNTNQDHVKDLQVNVLNMNWDQETFMHAKAPWDGDSTSLSMGEYMCTPVCLTDNGSS